MKRILFALMLLAGSSFAATDLKWQTGRIVDASNTKLLNGSDQASYVIECADKMYVVAHVIARITKLYIPTGKALNLAVGDDVKFAVAKRAAYVIDQNGKVQRLDLLRVSLKAVATP
jgi:hypothetical protein